MLGYLRIDRDPWMLFEILAPLGLAQRDHKGFIGYPLQEAPLMGVLFLGSRSVIRNHLVPVVRDLTLNLLE